MHFLHSHRAGKVKICQKAVKNRVTSRLNVKNQTVRPSAVPTSMKMRYSPLPTSRAKTRFAVRHVKINHRSST